MSKISNYSENEDDPEVYESSGDEWNSSSEKKSNNRRSSQRLSKRPRAAVVEDESSTTSEEEEDDDDSSDDEPRKRQNKNGWNKKQKITNSNANSTSNSNPNNSPSNTNSNTTSPSSDSAKAGGTPSAVPVARGIHRKFIPKTIFSEDYATGSFVILKKDAQIGDPSKHPSIWRIDGKALLQKYEAYDDDGKVRHKNTSVYTGWSPMDKDLYAPVTVDVIQHNNQNLTVELHWDKLKEINMDSD